MNRVMAIDPSLTGFAICILGEKGEIVYQDELKTKAVKTLKDRIKRMEKLALASQQLAQDYSPDYILIEGYAFNAKGSSGVSLGELGMLVRYFVVSYSKCLVEVPPTTLKKFISGKGNAGKAEIVSTLSSSRIWISPYIPLFIRAIRKRDRSNTVVLRPPAG